MEQLNNKSDRDLLIMAVTDLKHLKDEFEKISGDVGFPRCAARKEQIENLQSSVKWTKRFSLGALVTFMGALLSSIFRP